MSDAGTMYANAKALHELLQESRAENAELRKERDALDHLTDVLDATNDGLLAENAKLRELAERAWKTAKRLCFVFDGPCSSDGVTAYDPCPMGECDEECVYGQLQRELRELGVEV